MSQRKGFVCAIGAVSCAGVLSVLIYCANHLPQPQSFSESVCQMSLGFIITLTISGMICLTLIGLIPEDEKDKSVPTPAPAPDDGGK